VAIAAVIVDVLKGHNFSRAARARLRTRALAPEGRPEAAMNRKPMSWAITALMFGGMLACTFGLDMVFSPALRHQVSSLHSDLWQVAVPGDALGNAIIAIAMRVAFNWHLSDRSQTDLNASKLGIPKK
jgi:hypothetical protein